MRQKANKAGQEEAVTQMTVDPSAKLITVILEEVLASPLCAGPSPHIVHATYPQ
jgi:hypothetical protein